MFVTKKANRYYIHDTLKYVYKRFDGSSSWPDVPVPVFCIKYNIMASIVTEIAYTAARTNWMVVRRIRSITGFACILVS